MSGAGCQETKRLTFGSRETLRMINIIIKNKNEDDCDHSAGCSGLLEAAASVSALPLTSA